MKKNILIAILVLISATLLIYARIKATEAEANFLLADEQREIAERATEEAQRQQELAEEAAAEAQTQSQRAEEALKHCK
ncbi:MAG: hypothetical protein Tsb0034_22780 [Ekhidna sp.]